MASLIPLDVLNIILDRVAPSDLATVCRTSKAVYPYSRNALYRHLHLTPRNVLNACFALCKDPSVGACVQSFILTGPDVQMSLGVIQDTLLLMPQLRTLVLTIGSYGSWILPQDNSCPFQLSTFKSEFPFVKDVRNFVSGQRELRRLWLSSGTISTPSTSISYAAGSFPQLTSIVAPLLVVQEILPGCPVRDVAASADFGKFSKKMLDCLALSHAENGVQRLSTTRQCLFHVGGQRLASTTPSLTHLNVETIADPSQNAEYLLPTWMEQLVSQQRNLHCFTMRFHPERSIIRCQDIDFTPFVTKVFEASSSLQYVVIAFQRISARYTCKRMPGRDWFICDNFEDV